MPELETEATAAIDVLRTRGLGEPRRASLVLKEPRKLETPGAVLEALRSFGGRGWICFTDRVETAGPDQPVGDGIPLSAEICKGPISLHLRQEDAGWRLQEIALSAGDDQLVFTERRPLIGGGVLVYEVAWRRGADAWRPWCARLSDVEDSRPSEVERGGA